jgi:RHS repeat-associated protein
VAYDGNGNVSALVNAANGATVANYEYGPFGEVIRATGPMAKLNPFRFSTKYQDDETDFLYYGYRYYNPSTGRWLSRDPIEEKGGKNLYGFVSNDPVDKADARGKAEIKIDYKDGTSTTIWNPTLAKLQAALQGAINNGNLIDRIFIKGHGDTTTIWVDGGGIGSILWGGEYLEVKGGQLRGSDNTDFTPLFRGATTANGLVVFNGCETGRGNNSLAQQTSTLLQNRTVVGGAGLRQWGCPFSARCVVGKKNYFINGQLENSQW